MLRKKTKFVLLLILTFAIPVVNAQTKVSASADTIVVTIGNTDFRMIKVKAGDFVMGSYNSIEDCEDEKQMHKVTFTKDYYIGETEVTQRLWLEIMSANPSVFKNDQNPVDNVSWNDCAEFIKKLNERTGLKFRMPTEAEWEFAARGGNKSHGYLYSGGDILASVGWYKYNSFFSTHLSKRRTCNELGLYDMTGNVWEFCSDWYARDYGVNPVVDPKGPATGDMRITRGGAWFNDTTQCRITYRNPCKPTQSGNGLGLRLALSDTMRIAVESHVTSRETKNEGNPDSLDIHEGVKGLVSRSATADTAYTKHTEYPMSHVIKGWSNHNFVFCCYDDNRVYNLRSSQYCKLDFVVDAKMSPASFAFAALHGTQKNSGVGLYSTKDGKYFHNFRGIGKARPVDFCFTADARNIAILYDNMEMTIYGMTQYKPLRKLSFPFMPDYWTLSDNSYYVAMVHGNKVYIYNFETGMERAVLNIEAKVNHVAFSANSEQMAVLTKGGKMYLYDTRTFTKQKTVEYLDKALECCFYPEGKYISVVISPNEISIINLKDLEDRQIIVKKSDGINHIGYAKSVKGVIYLIYSSGRKMVFHSLDNLVPDYQAIVASEVDERMAEWQKQRKDETLEEYLLRVNDETRLQKFLELQNEVSTTLEGDMVNEAEVSFGGFDKESHTLEIKFDNYPPIYLEIDQQDIAHFSDAEDLVFENTVYSVDDKDNFVLLYTEVTNKSNGKKYVFDNQQKKSADIAKNEKSFVPLEIIRQSSIDEIKLESMKQEIVNQAMDSNLISDQTHINVKTSVVPSTDADGKEIMNYNIDFNYYVEKEFSTRDDYKPAQYVCTESEAAMAMLRIVSKALEVQFAQYCAPGKKVLITLYGSADATPVNRIIKYNGEYGNFINEIVYNKGELGSITVTSADGITTNEQLSFLRAASVKDYIETNLEQLKGMVTDYDYNISVSSESGSEYRRIGVKFTFIDAFKE